MKVSTLLVVTVCLLGSGLLHAGETISVDEWIYEAPEGWSIDVSTKPPRSLGPRNELVQFSSFTLPRLSEGEEARKKRAEVESLALEAVSNGAVSDGMKVSRPLSRKELTPEVVMHEVESRNSSAKEMLVSFLLVGPRAMVLVTYEAKSPGLSLKEIRDSLRGIEWTP